MSDRIAGIEIQGPPVFLLGARPIPLGLLDQRQRSVGFGHRVIDFQGFQRRRFRLGEGLIGRKPMIATDDDVLVRHASVGKGIGRVHLDRSLEVLQAFHYGFAVSLIPKVAALEIGFVCIQLDRPRR